MFRYKNTYCAQCHGVSEIAYWIMEIGCIEVGNDECSYPLNGQQNPSNLEEEIDRQVEIFINNPNATQLHRYISLAIPKLIYMYFGERFYPIVRRTFSLESTSTLLLTKLLNLITEME